MEALTAASVAALAVYDMVKAVEKGVTIERVVLLEKSGGKSGHWKRAQPPAPGTGHPRPKPTPLKAQPRAPRAGRPRPKPASRSPLQAQPPAPSAGHPRPKPASPSPLQ